MKASFGNFSRAAQSDDIAIGIDLGGTNFRAGRYHGLARLACDYSEQALDRVRSTAEVNIAEVGAQRSPSAIVERMASAVRTLAEGCKPTKKIPVGIGFAGMLRGTDGYVVHSPHLRWHDEPFGAQLQEQLGDGFHLFVENDVNAITIAECIIGAARGHDHVLAVFIGTGMGGGIWARGAIVTGANGCAAEIGHTKVAFDENARLCACGRRGCVEAYVGGEALRARARAELGAGRNSLALELAGSADKVTASHLDQAAIQGDEYALAIVQEVAPLAGAAIANAATLLNPSCLVLGGGVLANAPFLRAQVQTAIEVVINPPAATNLTICDARLVDDAGLVGSALLALNRAP